MEIDFKQFQASSLYLMTLHNMHDYVDRVNDQNTTLEHAKYDSWRENQERALGLITPNNPNMTLEKVNQNQFIPSKKRLIVDAPTESFGDQNTITIIEGDFVFNPSPIHFELPSRLQGHITNVNPETGERVANQS